MDQLYGGRQVGLRSNQTTDTAGSISNYDIRLLDFGLVFYWRFNHRLLGSLNCKFFKLGDTNHLKVG